MDGRGASAAGAPAGPVPADTPELPPDKAFVVQLSRETGPALEPFAGRVEHLDTGHRARFSSFEEFLAAVIRLLVEASTGEGGRPPRST